MNRVCVEIPFTEEQELEIVRIYNKKEIGMWEIGKIFGCSRTPIKRVLSKWGYKR